jgi:hypothetical protein
VWLIRGGASRPVTERTGLLLHWSAVLLLVPRNQGRFF